MVLNELYKTHLKHRKNMNSVSYRWPTNVAPILKAGATVSYRARSWHVDVASALFLGSTLLPCLRVRADRNLVDSGADDRVCSKTGKMWLSQ